MVKRVSTRKIKKDRLYTYEEAGDALGLIGQTVRSWRSDGLHVMIDRKPHYILGEALIEFIETRQVKRSVKLGVDQMLCFGCKQPRKPLGALVDYVPINDIRGRFVGLCEVCERPLQRFVSKADLGRFGEIFDIAIKGEA